MAGLVYHGPYISYIATINHIGFVISSVAVRSVGYSHGTIIAKFTKADDDMIVLNRDAR